MELLFLQAIRRAHPVEVVVVLTAGRPRQILAGAVGKVPAQNGEIDRLAPSGISAVGPSVAFGGGDKILLAPIGGDVAALLKPGSRERVNGGRKRGVLLKLQG